MPRNGFDVPGLYPVFVLQRIGFMDAAEQMAASLHRCGGDVCRIDHRLDSHLFMVVQRRRYVPLFVLERHVHLLGIYGGI